MINNSQKKTRRIEITFILLLFTISRLFSYFILEVKPLSLQSTWQLIPMHLLKDDLLTSLFYLHTQPFLWNFVVGIIAKLDSLNISLLGSLYLLNIFISFCIIFFSWMLTKKINLGIKFRLFVSLFFTLSPIILFYENLVYHYAHYSALVLVIFAYLTITLYKKQKFSTEVSIYILILISSFIWAIFQPLLIVIFFIFFRLTLKRKLNFKKFLVTAIIILVSFMPHIKNKFIYGVFTSSSWFGLNLSSTISYHVNDRCNWHVLMNSDQNDYENFFITFNKKKTLFNHELTKENLHSVGLIYKSKICLNETLKLVKERPLHWLKVRFMQIISSHGKLSIDYGLRPLAYNEYFSFYYDLDKKNISKTLRKLILCSYMLLVYIFFIKIIFYSKEKLFIKKSYFCILLFYSYIIFSGHFFNGVEHAKITYAGSFVNILFVIAILNVFKNKLTSVQKNIKHI